jgi:integrase-like protein
MERATTAGISSRFRKFTMTGSLYKRGRIWWMAYMVDGEQQCESTGTTNKRLAQKILNLRITEIIEGRFRLPRSDAPRFKQFSQQFLDSIRHENTRKRYKSSVINLLSYFGDIRLSEITPERIEEFKDARLKETKCELRQ